MKDVDLLIKAENEHMSNGELPQASIFDYHIGHIYEHLEYLQENNVENYKVFLDHVQEHMDLLNKVYEW